MLSWFAMRSSEQQRHGNDVEPEPTSIPQAKRCVQTYRHVSDPVEIKPNDKTPRGTRRALRVVGADAVSLQAAVAR